MPAGSDKHVRLQCLVCTNEIIQREQNNALAWRSGMATGAAWLISLAAQDQHAIRSGDYNRRACLYTPDTLPRLPFVSEIAVALMVLSTCTLQVTTSSWQHLSMVEESTTTSHCPKHLLSPATGGLAPAGPLCTRDPPIHGSDRSAPQGNTGCIRKDSRSSGRRHWNHRL